MVDRGAADPGLYAGGKDEEVYEAAAPVGRDDRHAGAVAHLSRSGLLANHVRREGDGPR
jgi:hypothetical protein